MSVLTIEMCGDFDLRRKTISVERRTDVNGAAAEIQNSFGFLMLCNSKLRLLFREVKELLVTNYLAHYDCRHSLAVVWHLGLAVGLTICLVARRNTKNPKPMTIVCHDHCTSLIKG